MFNLTKQPVYFDVEELIDEDDWRVGYKCLECDSKEFNVLERFGEIKLLCTSCGNQMHLPTLFQ